jgi:hypothetical protein
MPANVSPIIQKWNIQKEKREEGGGKGRSCMTFCHRYFMERVGNLMSELILTPLQSWL